MTRAELWMDGYLDTEELTNTEIADLIQLYEGRTATNEASMQLLSLLEEAERRSEEAELIRKQPSLAPSPFEAWVAAGKSCGACDGNFDCHDTGICIRQ
jgi:hypothetical protein